MCFLRTEPPEQVPDTFRGAVHRRPSVATERPRVRRESLKREHRMLRTMCVASPVILLCLLVSATAHAQQVVDEAEVVEGDAAESRPATLPGSVLAPSKTGDEEPRGESPEVVDTSHDEEAKSEGETESAESFFGRDRLPATSMGAVLGGVTGLLAGLVPFGCGVGVAGAGGAYLSASGADPRAYQYILIPPLLGLLASMLTMPVCSSGLASVGTLVAGGLHDGTSPGFWQALATIGAGLAPVLIPLTLFGGGMAVLLVPADVSVTFEALSVGIGSILVSGVLAAVAGPVLSVAVNNLVATETEELDTEKEE